MIKLQHSALEMLASNGPNQFLSAPAHGFLVTFSPDNFLQFPHQASLSLNFIQL